MYDMKALYEAESVENAVALRLEHPEAQFVENPEPTSPFGTKALGEPPACSGAPAIRNAIYNATGVAIDTVPITPHVLYAEFSKAGLIHDSWKEEK